MGCFIDQKLSFSYVIPALIASWKPMEKLDVLLDDDIYHFKFHNPIGRAKMFDKGSFHMAGKFFIIMPWSLQIEKEIYKISLSLHYGLNCLLFQSLSNFLEVLVV